MRHYFPVNNLNRNYKMPPRKIVSEFMNTLSQKIKESRQVADTTAVEYVNLLKQLNGGEPYTNLSFLKNREAVMNKITGYAESTQKSVLGAVVSILSLVKDKTTYKATYNFYYERMMEASKKARAKDSSVKTETQESNWLSWDDVVKRFNELGEKVNEFKKNKMITPGQWNTLLSYTLLALYTLQPPRRNQDYQNLYIVKSAKADTDKDKNFYETATKKFIFNKYKTSKTHGVNEIEIGDNKTLQDILATYIKFHPSSRGTKGEIRFLVNADGSALTSANSITRILNKIFGKQVGSSMLRHIYLSSKYGNKVEEMKTDAEAMGHTTEQQREYIKN